MAFESMDDSAPVLPMLPFIVHDLKASWTGTSKAWEALSIYRRCTARRVGAPVDGSSSGRKDSAARTPCCLMQERPRLAEGCKC